MARRLVVTHISRRTFTQSVFFLTLLFHKERQTHKQTEKRQTGKTRNAAFWTTACVRW